MKGIILAGGTGTRLYPMTYAVSKQLLPVYDKPMIYYPLSVLMLANIRDILIITTPQDLALFQLLFEDGSHLGLNISYAEQPAPEGIAQAFIIGKEFIGEDRVCLILGDNIFYGERLSHQLKNATQQKTGGMIFGYWIKNPERYGVVCFDTEGQVIDVEEKPIIPKSNWAVTGLYIYDNRVIDIAMNLKPSKRGEIEITDVNRAYLELDALKLEKLGRGIAWLDTGTPESLIQASSFIEVIESRQGLKIACIEEIAFNMGYIQAEQLEKLAHSFNGNNYGKYLLSVLKQEKPEI